MSPAEYMIVLSAGNTGTAFRMCLNGFQNMPGRFSERSFISFQKGLYWKSKGTLLEAERSFIGG